MGHKQTSRHCSGWVRFTPQSGHAPGRLGMSAMCQLWTLADLFDHLVGNST